MRYGFVIDNRKCIGCHACTTACKSEHNVPIGVNRTWVKQVEKGVFPHTRRLFSVMRCNHCTDAPCVEICPVEALYFREDGIVDFDKDRCIGCKSCMQACPYDALYIDPETHTAAKCNYCAHRVDIGLEPACVNVCPEHAIISGDMDNPESEIAQLLARQQVKVRKPEKGTQPNLFYIDGDEASLNPSATPKTGEYFWNSQSLGVGHFAKEAEKMAFSNGDVVAAVLEANNQYTSAGDVAKHGPKKSVEVLMGKEARRIYDTPNKGILWGWEVSGYVWTKAISAGVFLVLLLATMLGTTTPGIVAEWWTLGIGLIFLTLTGALLVKDLDQPRRFLYVLLRPHWSSWLVKGGYSITLYGGLLTLLGVILYFELDQLKMPLMWVTGLTALLVAVYTAFLFGQAKGRDFWQSPSLAIHMLVHSFMAGAAALALVSALTDTSVSWSVFLGSVMAIGIVVNLLTMLIELTMTHPTVDTHTVVHMITKGRYASKFYLGVVLMGNLLPMGLLLFGSGQPILYLAAILVLIGIYLTESIWVEAPQRIALS
ncbi:MAG TPA: polysulfide reductase NrfD [Saprospiraceae bacterium]|nr:polysulfide reductase NrfD [Saprospiraceae bacterium]HMQ84588.1 polysulfide reductase NrfD [Saprospiraceae bacterium]